MDRSFPDCPNNRVAAASQYQYRVNRTLFTGVDWRNPLVAPPHSSQTPSADRHASLSPSRAVQNTANRKRGDLAATEPCKWAEHDREAALLTVPDAGDDRRQPLVLDSRQYLGLLHPENPIRFGSVRLSPDCFRSSLNSGRSVVEAWTANFDPDRTSTKTAI